MKFISSLSNSDCLFTCLKILLSNLNKDKNYLFLSNPHLDIPFSFSEIANISKKYGLTLQGFQCDSVEDIINNKMPLIVQIKNENSKSFHAIIIKKITKKRVEIIDPSHGKETWKIQSFINAFTGYGLMILNHAKKRCPIKPISTISKADIFFIGFLQIMSGISCLAATYFISSQFPFYVPVILFVFFFLFEIILRRYLVYVMEKMDEKFLYSISQIKDYSKYYEQYTKMKANNIMSFTNSLFSLMMFIFLVVLIVMNSWINIVYVVVVTVLSLITVTIIQPYFNKLNAKIEKEERLLNNVQNQEEFIEKTRLINKQGYKFGLGQKALRYAKIGVYLFSVILVMAISSKTINVTYIVFYLTIMIIMDQYFQDMVAVEKSYKKYLNSKCYINQFYQ